VECNILRREDIEKAICNEFSGDLNKSRKPKFTKPVQTFTDTFLRKHGFSTIDKNGCCETVTRFKDAIEWRFVGLKCVMHQRSAAKNRKAVNKKNKKVAGGKLPAIHKAKNNKCLLAAKKYTSKAKFPLL